MLLDAILLSDASCLARQIVRRTPQTRVLILSMHMADAYVARALQAGATGYLLKDSRNATRRDLGTMGEAQTEAAVPL